MTRAAENGQPGNDEPGMSRPWLLHALPGVSRGAVNLYYHATLAGEDPPPSGPALFVANHPNSGFDPAFVAASARRPIRFLAKAPLFDQPIIGSLLKACGAIPVYRRKDDPGLMDRNVEMFAAVQEALASGSAVGIFPEGISHNRPSMAPLRTGAARICLGAAERYDGAFPIVPVGILLRQKERFRSPAVAVVGPAVGWDDLAGRGPDDTDAVRELTSRVEESLHKVTLNLEDWEDAPAIRFAEAVYAAEFRLPRRRDDRVRRERRIAAILAKLRRSDPDRLAGITDRSVRFAELLAAVGARPGDLERRRAPRAAGLWSLRHSLLFLGAGPLALLGHVVFLVPYQVTDLVGSRRVLERDVRATYKLLWGAVLYSAWIALLTAAAGILVDLRLIPLVLTGMPALGLVTLWVRERWRDDRARVMRYIRFRRRGDLRGRLLMERRELANELDSLRWELDPGSAESWGGPAGPPEAKAPPTAN